MNENATAALHKLSSEMTDLLIHIQMTRAVVDSFAGEYIDTDDDRLKIAVLGNPDNYRNLFNAFCTLLKMVDDQADRLDKAIMEAFHDALKAG